MTEQDLQELENAARIILSFIQRNKIHNENADARRSQFKMFINKQKENAETAQPLGEVVKNKSISFEEIQKEVKEMLLTINIKGSVRLRKDGLYELRTKYGSVYGHSTEELKTKILEKLSLDKKTVDRSSTTDTWKGSIKKKNKKLCPLFSEFFEKSYFPYKEQELAEKSLIGMRYNYNFIIGQKFDYALDEYTPKAITEFLLSIPQTRKRQIIQGLLNNVFKYAVQMGILKSTPTECIEPMKHKTKKGTAFSFKEQKEFFTKLFADDKIPVEKKCYLVFVYLTGARRNEALYLTIDDVQDVLHLPGTKTDGSNRYIPLFPLVDNLLKKLSPTINGRYFPFSYHVAEDIFKRYSQNHKLHDLRHTFGTIQICVNKLDAKTVSLYMGHSTLDTTLRIYTHPEQLDRATFLNGMLSEEEKTERLKAQSLEIQRIIENFINGLPIKKS